jgi:ornithine cyclodeaminase/alanine dehydrogenase-like protein (mu-crystallin family)
MRIVDAETTRRHLPFDRLIDALAAGFAAGCEAPLRHRHEIAVPGGRDASVLIMPAWRPGGLFGIKTVAIHPGNAAHGLPGLHSTYLLMAADTGVPLAIIDGNEITSRRTAVASALAARFLARPEASCLLVVGAGRVARLLPEAYGAVRTLRRVEVWARRPEAAEALAAGCRQQNIDAVAVADLAQAAGRADIISCATLSEAPLLRGAWLRPGVHLDLIGAFTPAMRETDDACFSGSRVFIDTEEALAKAGDLLAPMASGVFHAGAVVATLAQLCRGERRGRADAGDITLFKSVGNALEDLVAATLVHEGIEGGARHP